MSRSMFRAPPGYRREDWGQEVRVTTTRKLETCSICGRQIAAGEQAQVRSFVATFSCATCPVPSETMPACTCGHCWRCAEQARVAARKAS